MHLRSEERCVVFYEYEDFAAFTIHLQEIDVFYLVFLKKILEGYRLHFKSFAIRIILWSIRVGFDNFATPCFFTVSAYLQKGCAVLRCNSVWIECEVGMVPVIFFYRLDTIRIRFTTDDGRSAMAQRVFDECPLIAANIHNKVMFFY